MRIKAYGIKIQGNKNFCDQTKLALDLLKEKDGHNLKRAMKFFRFIVQYKVSGTTPNQKVFFVGNKTAFSNPKDIQFSIIWYASCIMHDAVHQEIFRRFKRTDENEMERWEIICCRLQIKCLKKIGGDARHFEIMDNAMKTKYWEGERKY